MTTFFRPPSVKKPVTPIRFADYGVNMVSSGIIVQKEFLKNKPDDATAHNGAGFALE